MDNVSRFALPGVVFLLTLASGVWLSYAGKPLNTLIFNVHKLIALAAVLASAARVYGVLDRVRAQIPLTALVILVALCVAALFASGALMSMSKPGYGSLLTIHKAGLLLASGAGAVILYLLARTPV
jgi:hypothetical protein